MRMVKQPTRRALGGKDDDIVLAAMRFRNIPLKLRTG
jgi:hypothetical protein